MPNEKKTEKIVRDRLEAAKRQRGGTPFEYWEQQPDSEDKRMIQCLKNASKSGVGVGRPEFGIWSSKCPNLRIVVECKANPAKHASRGKDKPAEFAVDGVLHYAKHISQQFNTLAIAVSGENVRRARISHFWHFKGEKSPEAADFPNKILPPGDYIKSYLAHGKVANQALEGILKFTKQLNAELQKFQIQASNRSLLISAILMALEEHGFKSSYNQHANAKILMEDIRTRALAQMTTAGLKTETAAGIKSSYSFMDNLGKLGEGTGLVDLVDRLNEQVGSFQKTHEYYDLLGQFYVEFLHYAYSEKGLGIVLTPPHITELAVEIAEVKKRSVIYDNCAGTGGFLVAGMKQMIADAKGDAQLEKNIKRKGLLGTEDKAPMAALLCSNMFIHGDGRSNVFQGDCFSEQIRKRVKKFKPTVGLLNPPFEAQGGRPEWDFVMNNLEALSPGSKCVALMPVSCLSSDTQTVELKARVLEKHTLSAVFSLPEALFHNNKADVVTCLVALTAHRPHPKNASTWFGMCREDGFYIKTKIGRGDFDGKWPGIRSKWVDAYRKNKSIKGFSVVRAVKAEDEWCAETFLNTDYAAWIKSGKIEERVRKYAEYIVARNMRRYLETGEWEREITPVPVKPGTVALPPLAKWRAFKLTDIFDVSGTTTTPLSKLKELGDGPHPHISTKAVNNGVRGYYNHFTEQGGVIIVESVANSFASYQEEDFSASDHTEKLTPKFKMGGHLALFFAAIISADGWRYVYGRGASQQRLKTRKLKLPVDKKGNPDYALMERYIHSLPFSKAVK